MKVPSLSGLLRHLPKLLGVLLVIVTLLLYVQVTHHQFIYGLDDDIYVTDNIHVRSGFSLPNIAWAFTSMEPFYWHPLTWLSHMLDCQLFGLNPGAHHYGNVVIHALNAWLLFWVLHRGTNALWRSFVVAALFAVHPLNVETVAWVAERKSLLSVMFSLLVIAAYGRYARHTGWKRYAAVVAAFIAALLCKPAAVTLPLVLLFLDYWPLDRFEELRISWRWAHLALEKLPLLLIALGISAVTLLGQRAGGGFVPFSVLPVYTRIETAVISYVTYIGKMLWPANLSVFYPHPASMMGPSLPIGDVISSAIILTGITALVWYYRRDRYLVVGWYVFVITLLPMIGIIQIGYQGVQDHFAYVPCIGLFIALTWGGAALFEHLSIRTAIPTAAALLIIGGYAARTSQRLQYWEDGVKLFVQARDAAGQPHPWLEQLYANALKSAGRVDEALQHYEQSCALGPRNEYCHYYIAEIFFSRGQFRIAVEEYQTALMLTGNRDIALNCLNKSGEALLHVGEYNAAEHFITQALRVDPQDATASRLRELLLTKNRPN